jgi:hypothetical protein
MTSPRNAQSTGGRRFYTWRQKRFWSATTLINGGTPKPALPYWAAKRTAECAADNIELLAQMLESEGREAVIDFLKRAPWRDRDKAADLGSSLHAAAEAYALGKPMPPWSLLVKPHMESFVRFLEDYRPKIEMTEASVYNGKESYAGTLDYIGKIGRRRLLWDVKSGSGVYAEVGLQLALYRFAEWIGLPDGSEKPMPKVDGCAVLHLNSDYERGYDFREVRADEDIFQMALYVREVFRFQTDVAKHVLGPTIKPPRARRKASEPEPQASVPQDPSSRSSRLPGGRATEQPSGSESQIALLPTGPRTLEQEEALGLDIFGEAV